MLRKEHTSNIFLALLLFSRSWHVSVFQLSQLLVADNWWCSVLSPAFSNKYKVTALESWQAPGVFPSASKLLSPFIFSHKLSLLLPTPEFLLSVLSFVLSVGVAHRDAPHSSGCTVLLCVLCATVCFCLNPQHNQDLMAQSPIILSVNADTM